VIVRLLSKLVCGWRLTSSPTQRLPRRPGSFLTVLLPPQLLQQERAALFVAVVPVTVAEGMGLLLMQEAGCCGFARRCWGR